MFRRLRMSFVATVALAIGLPVGDLAAQGIGNYLNFETPQLRPMVAIPFEVGPVLVVCNSPDNTIEIFDARSDAFLARVPTGLEPVSVALKPSPSGDGVRRLYTTNWLGDSITIIDLWRQDDGSMGTRLISTEDVGDEPMMIAFLPPNEDDARTLPGGPLHESLIVTFSAARQWAWLDPLSLAPIQAGSDAIELLYTLTEDQTLGVKDPRMVGFTPPTSRNGNLPNQLCILNFQGGNDSNFYDFDVWTTDDVATSAGTGYANRPAVAGTGTTNFSFDFSRSGDMFIASQNARNKDPLLVPDEIMAVGEPIMRQLVDNDTGFVTSQLVRVRGVGTSTPQIDILDLNQLTSEDAIPVTQPTDVLVFESENGEEELRVFVAGYNSDSLAVVNASGALPWSDVRIDLSTSTPFAPQNTAGTVRGPRAFTSIQMPGFERVFVYNRLEHSVTTLDPNFNLANPQSAILSTYSLTDPTPDYIKNHRKFLYSSRLSSTGSVSCASCHIDGNTDFLAWNLSDGIPVPPTGQGEFGALGPNPGLKGPMVTQPLRGLVNWEVIDPNDQRLCFTNAPYHWRGDRAFFPSFNGAFPNLMGLSQELSDTDMTLYEVFVNSIHYPPNPEQRDDRTYDGSIGVGTDPYNDPTTGTGSVLGQKIFHVGLNNNGSCVGCHAQPEGSNPLITDNFLYFGSALPIQGLETAQIRGMVLKERFLTRVDGTGNIVDVPGPPAVTSEFGMVHTGKNTLAILDAGGQVSLTNFDSDSTIDFVEGFGMTSTNTNAVARFVREFDNGLAPIIGRAFSVDTARWMTNSIPIVADLNLAEGEAEKVNAGVTVYARINGVRRGFWYDSSSQSAPYTEEQQGSMATIGPFSRQALLNFIDPASGQSSPDNLLIFQSVPLGSERRIALLTGGQAPMLSPMTPSNVTLLSCVPNSSNLNIPQMTGSFSALLNLTPPNRFNATMFLYETSLANHASATPPAPNLPNFGLSQPRWEPARRFRLQGDGIKTGAWVKLYTPLATDIATVTLPNGPTTIPTSATHPFVFEFPLYPGFDGTQETWETADELEPMFLLMLMNGGPFNPAALLAYLNPYDASFANWYPGGSGSTNTMDPDRWNWIGLALVDPNNPLTDIWIGWFHINMG